MKQRNDKIKVWVPWGAVVCWMLLIFLLSSQGPVATGELSMSVTEKVVDRVAIEQPDITFWNFIARQVAHVFLYLMLGVFLCMAFSFTFEKGRRVCFWAFGIGLLYAISDEFHQMFVPGRDADLADIFFDGMGLLLGLFIFRVFTLIRIRYSVK
jgi:VanZ family protein